jgi:peroxiredoxin
MRVPYTNFKTRTGDDQAVGGCALIGGEWKDLDTAEIFDGKKVVVFALPGAFTPTCSSQQLPGYEEKYDELKALGVDEIYCLSVNDAFVMNAWARDQKIEKVKVLPDGSGVFTQGMGMLVNKDHVGFGMRSWRYSMYVEDGKINKIFEEPGKNNAGENGDPFEVSKAETMVKYLKGLNAG